MGAPIQRLWRYIPHWPVASALHAREPVPTRPEVPEKTELDAILVTFHECEGECGPAAERLEAQERERAERFRRDQLLPIMGWAPGIVPWGIAELHVESLN